MMSPSSPTYLPKHIEVKVLKEEGLISIQRQTIGTCHCCLSAYLPPR